ncbi:MAG TPA: hypothetical protein VI653_06520, partial [Steroidobacteraceae bacterium]
ALCGQPVGKWYFRVNSAMSCMNCAQAARNATPEDSHAAFVRALLYGVGAAIVGLILYSVFGIVTGLVIGYLSLGVGYLVGKAMMMGSRGVGGRRYQVAAVLLTYAAVSMSAIPMAVAYGIKHRQAAQVQSSGTQPHANAEQQVSSAESDRELQQEFGGAAAKPLPARPGAKNGAAGAEQPSAMRNEQNARQPAQVRVSGGVRPSPNFAAALGYLAVLGLASPFLELQEPVGGVIGLIILMVGIRIAWQLTGAKQAEIIGPFENTAAKA